MKSCPSCALLRESLDIERRRVDSFLAARSATPSTAPAESFEPPETPPDAVMAAIKTISPTRDRTYEANWLYWSANKERARLHPEAFADEILTGLTFDTGEGAEV